MHNKKNTTFGIYVIDQEGNPLKLLAVTHKNVDGLLKRLHRQYIEGAFAPLRPENLNTTGIEARAL